jgi:ATP-binding cassette subfamily B protein
LLAEKPTRPHYAEFNLVSLPWKTDASHFSTARRHGASWLTHKYLSTDKPLTSVPVQEKSPSLDATPVGYARSSGPKPISKLFTQLAPYVRPYFWMAIALLISLVFESSLESATRFSFRYLIDEAVIPRNYKRLTELLGLLGSAAVLLAGVSIIADYVWAKLGARVVSDLRSDLYMHVQTLSLDFFQRRKSGDLLSVLIADPETIESCLVTVVPYGLLGITGIVMSTTLMATIHKSMAMATLVGTTICFLLPRALLGKANRASFAMRQQEGRMSSAIQESLQSQYLIKAFGLERELFKRFRRETLSLVDLTVRANFLSYIVERIPAVSFFILCLGIIGGSAIVAFHGGMSIGSVVSFQVLALGLGSAIGNLTWLAPMVVSATAGLERINEVLDERPAMPEKRGAKTLVPFSQSIRFDHVSFAYPAPKDGSAGPRPLILRDLTLEIPRGKFMVIVGASGSGKTTLLQLLLRLYDPTQGSVIVDGADLRDVKVSSLRSQIGFVGQDVLLFDSTVRDNVRMGKLDATDREILEAMQAAECGHLVKKLPHGLDTLVGEKGAQLSGGERQRIALARALVRKPQILILDEGTSALDSRAESALLATLRSLASERNITVIAVTHRLGMAPLADRVVVIREGSVESDGPHTQLLGQQGTYASLWEQSTIH